MNLTSSSAVAERGPSAPAEPDACDTRASDVASAAGDPRFADTSPEAKRLAAAVLEVLAGTRGPGEAAAALGISVPRYYQLEGRALAGLVAACEPRRGGRGRRGPNELTGLRQECDRLRRECARQQALVRAAQRTVGLPPPPSPSPPRPAGTGRKRRRRRPKARALKVVAALREQTGTTPAVPVGGAHPTNCPAE
jgi:hypothetical protein